MCNMYVKMELTNGVFVFAVVSGEDKVVLVGCVDTFGLVDLRF
jgi:hypothetical protein